MSDIQDEAYTEAMLEIERLKRINGQLADLVACLIHALLDRTTEDEQARNLLAAYRQLIADARDAL